MLMQVGPTKRTEKGMVLLKIAVNFENAIEMLEMGRCAVCITGRVEKQGCVLEYDVKGGGEMPAFSQSISLTP